MIVSYEVAHADADRVLGSWEKANDFRQKQPGLVSTALHRAVSAHPGCGKVDVSCWENDDDFRSATQSQTSARHPGGCCPSRSTPRPTRS